MYRRLVVTFAFLLLLKSQATSAAGPVIWASPYPLNLSAGIHMQKSESAVSCAAGVAGSLRFTGSVFQACDGTAWSTLATGSSTNANTALSNLTSPTAIAVSLLPTASVNIGASTASWSNVFGNNLQAAVAVNTPQVQNNTSNLTFIISAKGSGNQNNMTLSVGNATAGNGGNLVLSIGTASATAGQIFMQDGSQGTAGQVWTSTDINGGGHWSAAAAGGGGVTSLTLANAGGLTAASTTGAITLGELIEPTGLRNCSINGAHSGSAFIVQIYTAAGATPSATDPCTVAFRSASVTTGNFTYLNVTAATAITAADTKTLGCVTGSTCPIYVYALNFNGSAEVAIASFSMKNEAALQTTVGTPASTVGQLYSNGVPRTAAAIRLLGEIQETIAAGSHWTSDPTTISTVPFKPYGAEWISYTPTVSTNSGSMTNATHTGKWRRRLDTIEINVYTSFSGAGGTWVAYYPSLPMGCVLDTAKILASTDHGSFLGNALVVDNGNANYLAVVGYTGGGGANVAVYPQSINVTGNAVYYAVNANMQGTVPITFGSSDTINSQFQIPCTGWGD